MEQLHNRQLLRRSPSLSAENILEVSAANVLL
jgi:hypothetical protein